jgi:hypothetical protein
MYRMRQLELFLKRNRYYLYAVVVITLIIIHGKFDSFFKIDTLTLVLLLALFVLPYIPLIKTWKFKYGDFEAEVKTEEINELERKASKIPQQEDITENKALLGLRDLAESDPQLALAKVRIEIEKQIQTLYNTYNNNLSSRSKFLGLRAMVERLKAQGIIEVPLAAVLVDVIAVANRTIHGEDISVENAIKFVDTATTALAELEKVIIKHALKSVQTEIIDQATVDIYDDAEYLLTTITPLVDKPQRNIYKVNQTELSTYLAGYEEYAEYIVGLEKIQKSSKQA